MEVKEITDAIELASKALKEKAANAEALAKSALDSMNEFIVAQKEAKTASDEELAQLRADFNEMSAKTKKIEVSSESKAWDAQFAKIYAEKADEVKQTISRQKAPLVFEMKDIGLYNTVEAVGSASHYTVTQNTGIISAIRKRITSYLDRVSVGQLSLEKPYAMWIEELDETGTPIFIGEGDAKTAVNVRYEEREKKAKKIAVYSKVTTEMLKYLPQLISFIQNNLMKRVDLATEQNLITGDDTGDNLAGVLGYATTFTGGDMAGTVEAPNNWDVILGIISQARKAFGMVNGIYIRGGIIDSLLSTKGSDEHYIHPDGVTIDAQGQIIAWGVPLIRTEASLTYSAVDYDFFGGDLSVINVGFTGNMTVQVGLDGNDFTNNKKTILVEQELVQFVSANDTQVLVKGSFDAAKALLLATT